MIANFSIRNFGSVKDKQTLSFEATASDYLEDYFIVEPVKGVRLNKIALIYGANASGKTTILKALDFLRQVVISPAEKKTDPLKYEPFLFDPNTPGESSTLSIEFYQNAVLYAYEVEFNKEAIITEELYFSNPNRAKVFSRKTNVGHQFTEISFGSKIKIDKSAEKSLAANTLWNNTVLGGFLKTNIEIEELQDVVAWFLRSQRRMVETRTVLNNIITNEITKGTINKNTLIAILRKADFNITDILFKEEAKEISETTMKIFNAVNLSAEDIDKIKNNASKKIELEHTVNGTKYILPFDLESQGTRRYYGFSGLLALLIDKSIVYPIDELESSLHPDLYIHFLLSFLANSKQSQLIATTHNREILNNKDIFRNDAIWFTDKNEAQSTELYSLSDFDSSVVRDTSNVFNAYKSGKLGAVPELGDYYINTDKGNEKN